MAAATAAQPIAATLVTLLGSRTQVALHRVTHAPAHGSHHDTHVVEVRAAAAAGGAGNGKVAPGKLITTLPADTALAVTRAARLGNPLPRAACRARLPHTAAALAQVPADDIAANRSLAVHLLRLPSHLKDTAHLHAGRPSVETRGVKFESWTMQFPDEAAAVKAREQLATWLECPLHDGVPGRAVSKPWLVVVNPASGRRKGLKVLEQVVKPMLAIAGVPFDVHITTRMGHADEVVKGLADLTAYAGALAVGGDGIVHEVFQGLLKHSQVASGQVNPQSWPVAHVGAGTGNGLAASVDSVAFEVAVLCAVKGWSAPMDMLEYAVFPVEGEPGHDAAGSVTQPKEHGFLHLSWTHGFIADLDLDSEVLRFLGPLRSDIFAVWKMAKQTPYACRVSYILAGDTAAEQKARAAAPDGSLLRSPVRAEHGWTVRDPEVYMMINAQNTPHLSVEFNGCPYAHINTRSAHLVLAPHPIPVGDFLNVMLDQGSGALVTLPLIETLEVAAMVVEPLHPTRAAAFEAAVKHEHRGDAKWAKCRARGHMVVDGEPGAYGKVHMEVRPGLAALVVPRWLRYDAFKSKVPAMHELAARCVPTTQQLQQQQASAGATKKAA